MALVEGIEAAAAVAVNVVMTTFSCHTWGGRSPK